MAIMTKAFPGRVQVKYRGEVIADTRKAVRLEEGKYPPVYYIPRTDVRMDFLVPTSHRTHCPYKGDASYFSLKGGPENAVWSYELPLEDMKVIKEPPAFYPA